MRSVILIKDFADKKEGYEYKNLGSILCSKLVNIEKVAVYKEDYKPKNKVKTSK